MSADLRERITAILWATDDEWKKLDARQLLAPEADWGEWLTDALLREFDIKPKGEKVAEVGK